MPFLLLEDLEATDIETAEARRCCSTILRRRSNLIHVKKEMSETNSLER